MRGRARGAGLGCWVVVANGLFSTTARAGEADAVLPPPPAAPPGVPTPMTPAPTPMTPAPTPMSAEPAHENASAPFRFAFDDPDRKWYGWQLLISDTVAAGAVVGAAATLAGGSKSTLLAVFIPAAVVYDLGGPTIHWFHGRRGIAAASFGLRAGVPLVGLLVGAGIAQCHSKDTSASACSRGTAIGDVAGFAVASVLDATFFAWDAPQRRPTVGNWMPYFGAAEGGGTLGVQGRF